MHFLPLAVIVMSLNPMERNHKLYSESHGLVQQLQLLQLILLEGQRNEITFHMTKLAVCKIKLIVE